MGVEQVETAQGEERYDIVKTIEKFTKMNCGSLYAECVRFSFDEFCVQHIERIKNLIHLFPEDEKVKDKVTGEVIGNFWTGHKKFPQVPKFDLNEDAVLDYMYASSQLYAFMFNVPADQQPKSRDEFKKIAEGMNLTVPEWKAPTNLKIKVDEDDEDPEEDEKENEAKEKEIEDIMAKLKSMDKSKLLKAMQVADFEKDDDTNFHIDFIAAVCNTRARNYKIKETSRHKCKIIASKIIAALATTTAMICGLVELEFYKLKLGLGYVQQDAFYNANINLAVAQFQFFQPEAAVRAEEKSVYDPVMCMEEKHVPYPPNWTSWDSLVIDFGRSLTIGEFVKEFPKKFNGITVDLLFKAGKMEKGVLLYNHMIDRKKEDVLNTLLIEKYVKSYGDLVSEKRSYVILDGNFNTKDGDLANLPRIIYVFK